MLTRLDRVQLAVRDRVTAAQTFAAVFDGVTVGDDELPALAARRRTVRAGASEFELLEPAGPGPVQAFIDRWREGLFAVGFATPDLSALAVHLDREGVRSAEAGNQLLLDEGQTRGMRTVLSVDKAQPPAGGLMRGVYEVTNAVPDWQEAASHYARIFALDAARFSPITSHGFGYTGTLTLLNPPAQLDRIEVVTTTDPTGAMGRFSERRGPSLYMCFIEVDDISLLTDRLETNQKRWTAGAEEGSENTIFIHPTALHGMLMGVSRTSYAWTWSGRPELARVR